MNRRAPRLLRLRSLTAGLALVALLSGCSGGLNRIDRSVDDLIRGASGDIDADVRPVSSSLMQSTGSQSTATLYDERPGTVNPTAETLEFVPEPGSDAESVIARLEEYAASAEQARQLDLTAALACAVANSREFRFAEEEYVLAALRLLIERHRWGPRFFNDVSATISGSGDDGLFDTSLDLVNEFRVTQRLPYGGEVSARALASATEDLHQKVSGEGVQSADIILAADIPLLRGAGMVARESLIQLERDMVYAARDFERFRREFLFDIAADFLNLVVQVRRIETAERQVKAFEQLRDRQRALYEAGRATVLDAAEAQNDALDTIDSLNNTRESFRLSLDRFKVRIGIDIDEPVEVVPDRLDLPAPRTDMNGAIVTAMNYRLDLQTQRDALTDSRRAVEIAQNGLLGDLDLSASVAIPTDDDRDRQGLDFEPGDTSWNVGITYGLPLDREIERISVRQAQIAHARAERSYDRFRDDIAVTVRGAVRGIDSARFSYEIQQRNVEIAERRQAAIESDEDRADIRQKTDAINQLARARDALESARRDVDLAVLRYLLETGQLRVEDSGVIRELPGMATASDATP